MSNPEIIEAAYNLRAALRYRRPIGLRRAEGHGQGRVKFHAEWLVRKNIEKALEESLPSVLRASTCTGLTMCRPRRRPRRRASCKKGMTRAAEAIGLVKRLDGAVVAPEVRRRALKLVKRSEDQRFSSRPSPNPWARRPTARAAETDGDPDFSAAPATGYRTYYAAGFNFGNGNVAPATLWTVWRNVNGSWKVVSYALLSP